MYGTDFRIDLRGRCRLVVAALAVLACALSAGAYEVNMPAEAYKRLDTFEAHVLSEADDAYSAGKYRQAAAAYEAFLREFPRSKAVSYALIRKGRSLHLDEKRFEAIKVYNELMDYFPNHVHFASCALYFMGIAHWENGDEEKAVQPWAEIAEDKDYRQHFLAADAINRLADYLRKQGKYTEAVSYFRQLAVDFRRKNSSASNYAIGQVRAHLIRLRDPEPRLRQFYRDVETFGSTPREVPEDLSKDWTYWSTILSQVKRSARFSDKEKDKREAYFEYWAEIFDGRFPEHDAYCIDVAKFHLEHEKSITKWFGRMDAIFERKFKPGDWDRIMTWMVHYGRYKNKAMQYYNKVDFAKMSPHQIWRMMEITWDTLGDEELGRNTFRKIPIGELEDSDKAGLARYFWRKDNSEPIVLMICGMIEDEEFGKWELLQYYASAKKIDEALALCDELSTAERYASQVLWLKADLLFGAGRYREAIAAYQAVNEPPKNLWKIVDCYARLNLIEDAVIQLREIEAWFKSQAPAAALKVASLYAKRDRQRYVAELRSVLSKYPKSGQSSAAHRELERLGERIGGAVDAD